MPVIGKLGAMSRAGRALGPIVMVPVPASSPTTAASSPTTAASLAPASIDRASGDEIAAASQATNERTSSVIESVQFIRAEYGCEAGSALSRSLARSPRHAKMRLP